MEQNRPDKKQPRTTQATIPYERMWPDGVCRVTEKYYTKTIQFQDINYQLVQNDDRSKCIITKPGRIVDSIRR